MKYIDTIRAVRAIERTARQYGYGGDATLDPDTVRPLGTLGEQLAMVCVGLDSGVRLSQMSSRDQQWTRERLRSAVLGGKKGSQNSVNLNLGADLPQGNGGTAPTTSAKMQREWRRRK